MEAAGSCGNSSKLRQRELSRSRLFQRYLGDTPSPHTFFCKILILLELREFDVKNGGKILRTKGLQGKILETKELACEF